MPKRGSTWAIAESNPEARAKVNQQFAHKPPSLALTDVARFRRVLTPVHRVILAIRLEPSGEKVCERDSKTRHEVDPVTRRERWASYAPRNPVNGVPWPWAKYKAKCQTW
jgi:hypothetical protein